MMDQMTFSTDVKPKCRTMQESIYNYLSFMKSQISTTLDHLSRNIMNRLSSPLIFQSGYMGIHKKVKLHDYRGIETKELRKYVEFLE
jgi:hypothetical protein